MKLYKYAFKADGNEAATLADLKAALAEHGMVAVPEALTAEDGFKSKLMGEFYEPINIYCPECYGDGDIDGEPCDECDSVGSHLIQVPIKWDTIKKIHKAMIKAAEEGND